MLEFFRIYFNTEFAGDAFNWFLVHGTSIIIILVAAWIGKRILQQAVGKIIRKLVKRSARETRESEEKRENTLIQVINSVITIVIWSVTVLVVLSELGVAIGPLLAAAGVVGIAVGFAGQFIIRDFITGIILLTENQYRVGDVVCFDTVCGAVESVSLRKTTLRDLEGTVHHVPHGSVGRVSNRTAAFSRVNISIGVAYSSNIDRVAEVINRIGEELAEDTLWKDKVRTAPKFLRIDDFADSAIIIRILGETKAGSQWEVAGELRRRLKQAFDKEGIEIPFPQRVLHQPAVKTTRKKVTTKK